jgi:hypothetical protein
VSDSIPKCPNCGAFAVGVTLTHIVFSCGSDRKKGKDALDNQSEKCSQSNHEAPWSPQANARTADRSHTSPTQRRADGFSSAGRG